ncbi:hypothetical protein PM082_016572 [Marasmius tenuissimus]|nr:hypothetical protein PM082_016572 [Marasmius tenuissimus]
MCSIEVSRADKTLSIPISGELKDWAFNLRSLQWQYDMTSASVSLPRSPIFYDPLLLPLNKGSHPRLDINEIIGWSEHNFGDFLCMIASPTWWTKQLSDFARHGLLTFGTIAHPKKGTLAHFSSLSPPEWSCHSSTIGIQARYSKEVPDRIDLVFHTPGRIRGGIQLSLRAPPRLSAAYLAQSLNFLLDDNDPPSNLLFLNGLSFTLWGTFFHNPTTQHPSVYLFVPPIPVEYINGMYCVRYPLPDTLFYWSLDPAGKNRIPKRDWKKYGVPKLGITTWISSYWREYQYQTIREHLCAKGYDLDGKQYVCDYGYPELIIGDPHNYQIAELREETQPETFFSTLEPTCDSPAGQTTPPSKRDKTADLSIKPPCDSIRPHDSTMLTA